MTWTAPTGDLRKLLSDGPADKYRYRKKVFGEIDGTNKRFKTFEFRRVTNFVTEAAPSFLGVYVDGVKTAAAAIDDVATGEFEQASAPAAGSRVEATYYIQWFTDAELDEFISTGVGWLGLGDSPTNIDTGLQPAILKYASGEAFQKLSLRWIEHLSETYRLEDAIDPESKQLVNPFAQASVQFKKEAERLRDDFYKRQGQSLAPRFRTVVGNVKDPTPRR